MTLVVFTDLDGTLLDHETYGFDAARPALDALKARGIPLVLASSKTAAEVAPLHAELGLGDTPAIVENGAGIYRPVEGIAGNAEDHRYIRNALNRLMPDTRLCFIGFSDMSDAELAQQTGLSEEAAARAKTRQFSEPGIWNGDDLQRITFFSALESEGIRALRGGRFMTLSLGRTKGERMAELAGELGATATLALGDAPKRCGDAGRRRPGRDRAQRRGPGNRRTYG